jgi:hypothetical protein
MNRGALVFVVLLASFASACEPDAGAPPAASSSSSTAFAADAETAARAALGSPGDLRVTSVRRSLTGTHVRFAQLAPDGSIVADAECSVHFAGAGAPWIVRIVDDVASHHLTLTGARVISEDEAGRAAAIAAGGGQPDVIAAVAFPDAPGVVRAGWRVQVVTADPPHRWDVWVDGESGTATVKRDLLVRVDGSGYVFLPNPVMSTGDITLMDNANADSPALDAARYMVTLQGLDGTGVLRGQYVDSQPGMGARSSSASLTFLFNRSQTGFEETNAYYHLDAAQRHLQSLGFTGPMAIYDSPIPAYVNAYDSR